MNKQKLESLKKELRLQAPKIVGAAVIVTTIVVAYKMGKSSAAVVGRPSVIMNDGIGLAATKDMLNIMKDTGDSVLFDVEEGMFLLKQVKM